MSRCLLGWTRPLPAARRSLTRATVAGIDKILGPEDDTADSYGPFVSERLIREALHPYPEDLVIATKGGLTRAAPAAIELTEQEFIALANATS